MSAPKFFLLLVFLSTPTIFSEVFAQEFNFKIIFPVGYALYSIFWAGIFSAIIFGVAKINKAAAKFLQFAILAICAIIFLADAFALNYYGALINRTMLEIILATNANEASEFFLAYVLQPKFLAIVLLAAIIFFAICKIQLPRVKEKFAAIFLILIFIIVGTRLIKNPVQVFENGNSAFRLAIILPEVLKNMKAYEKLAASANHQVTITKNESNLPLVIFILGESTTRNHMQLYGYYLPTTPKLVERNLRGELNIFSDTVSPHSHTMPVLRKLFTFQRKENENENLNACNFFDILNAAGYYTAWLSNQEASGIFGNFGRLYAETCQSRKFTRLRDSKEEKFALLDEKILPLFDEELKNFREKSFYVLHLMGTHSIYNRRYPAAFEKFTAENPTRANYDNAVLYNDFIVDEIIKRVENLDAVVVYISDHGEDVFDDKDFAGHYESSPSRFMIEIPFIIWTSQKFRTLHADTEKRIAAAVDKPFMTDDIIYFLMDMLKIETSDFQATLSPLDENYNSARQRIYGGKIYDKEQGLH